MRETGKITTARGERAEVEVAARGECEHCTAAGICNWTGTSLRKVLAVNKVGARAGDTVELETTEGTGAKSNLLVFGIPVLLMLAGVLVGGLAVHKDTWSGILGGVGLVLGFGIIKAIDVAVNRSGRSLPVITRRLSAEEIRPVSECGNENQGEVDERVAGSNAGRGPDGGVR
jgi:positive regulator of sigma E activity